MPAKHAHPRACFHTSCHRHIRQHICLCCAGEITSNTGYYIVLHYSTDVTKVTLSILSHLYTHTYTQHRYPQTSHIKLRLSVTTHISQSIFATRVLCTDLMRTVH